MMNQLRDMYEYQQEIVNVTVRDAFYSTRPQVRVYDTLPCFFVPHTSPSLTINLKQSRCKVFSVSSLGGVLEAVGKVLFPTQLLVIVHNGATVASGMFQRNLITLICAVLQYQNPLKLEK